MAKAENLYLVKVLCGLKPKTIRYFVLGLKAEAIHNNGSNE
jgi:hypothetical protein